MRRKQGMVNSPHQPTSNAQPGAPKNTVETPEERATIMKHYETARKELRDLLARKKQADKDLATLESQIYKLEGSYLEDTQQGGNIVRGFDGYIKGVTNNRKSHFSESDRLFSLSSVSYSESAVSASNGTPDPREKSNKKKRRQMTEDLQGSDSEGSATHYSSTKRARITYAD